MRWSVLVFLVCLLGSTPWASADLVPPEVEECQGRRAGERCPSGICRSARCARLDYANWDRDASPSVPPSVAYDCLRCDDTGTSGDDASDDPDDDHDAGDDEDAEAAAGSSGTDKKSGGCTISGMRLGANAAALTFAAVCGWLVNRRRRGL